MPRQGRARSGSVEAISFGVHVPEVITILITLNTQGTPFIIKKYTFRDFCPLFRDECSQQAEAVHYGSRFVIPPPGPLADGIDEP